MINMHVFFPLSHVKSSVLRKSCICTFTIVDNHTLFSDHTLSLKFTDDLEDLNYQKNLKYLALIK